MKKKLISSILCTTMLFSLGTTTIYAQDDASTNEGTETPIVSETTETEENTVVETETNEILLPETTEKAGTPTEDVTPPAEDQVTQPEEIAYYDPTVNTDIEASLKVSDLTSKPLYYAGDIIDLSITFNTNSTTPLKFKDSYLWYTNPESINGSTLDLPQDLILSSEITHTVTLKYQVPWDLESEDFHFICSFETKNYDSSIGGGYLEFPVEPLTPIIENGVYKFENENAPERYLISFKLGDGITGYDTIAFGNGDERSHFNETTQRDDYYLRPGYPSSLGFYLDDKYYVKDENGYVTGVKDGYSIELKLIEGDGTYKATDNNFVFDFDINTPSTFEVQIKDNNAPEKTTTIENTSGVTMTLPEKEASGLTLQVTTSDDKAEQTAINKVVQVEGDKIKTFDLTLLKDGVPFEYNGQFTSTISLPIPKGWNMDQLALYYFNEETNEVTPVEFTVDKTNSTIIFNTNHFSKYVLVEKAVTTTTETKKETTKTKSVKTGVETNMTSNVMLWSNIALAAILGGLMLRKKPE